MATFRKRTSGAYDVYQGSVPVGVVQRTTPIQSHPWSFRSADGNYAGWRRTRRDAADALVRHYQGEAVLS